MNIEKINPFYRVTVNQYNELDIFSILEGKNIFKCRFNDSSDVKLKLELVIEKIGSALNRKLLVTDLEHDFLSSLKYYSDLIDTNLKIQVEFGKHFKSWLYNVNLEKITVTDKNISKVCLLKSKSENSEKEAIIELNSVDSSIVPMLINYLKDYTYAYFINKNKESVMIGPFISQDHILKENLIKILDNEEVENVFIDFEAVNDEKMYLQKLVMSMIIERSSDFLLSQTPLHNRKIILDDHNGIVNLGKNIGLI